MSHKIWLNGELVNDNPITVGIMIMSILFPVTLKQGKTLLVAIHNWQGDIAGFFGFAPDAEYTVPSPASNFAYPQVSTQIEKGDTFTLRLNAANVTDLAGWQTDITFDPALLKANVVTEGNFPETRAADAPSSRKARLTISKAKSPVSRLREPLQVVPAAKARFYR